MNTIYIQAYYYDIVFILSEKEMILLSTFNKGMLT